MQMCRVCAMSALLLVAALTSPLPAQDAPTRPPDQPVFRTGATLVTVDAVVTDKDGRHVTDLTVDDFELIADGKKRQVRHVVYVPLGGAPIVPDPSRFVGGESQPGAGGKVPASPIRRSPVDSSRVMAVVVDDLGLSFESTVAVRNALNKFIDRQVQSGDLVAILRTAGGVGALQQFTADKRLMHAAAERVQWTILSRSGVTAFTPASPDDALGDQTTSGSGTAEADDEDEIEYLRTTMLATASLNALEYITRGVERLPGRKAIVFFSEGFRLLTKPQGFGTAGSSRIWNAFTRLMDRANQAGVVVYSIDARGLATAMPTAEDNPQANSAAGTPVSAPVTTNTPVNLAANRKAFLLDSQEALRYAAEQTGGFAVLNNNDLNLGLARVLNDLRGYYLLGCDVSETEPRPWEPGRFTVRVTRPGLRVRSRGGLFGPSTPGRLAVAAPGDPLVNAALSPFGASDVAVRLTALFGYDTTAGPYVRSLLFIDANSLQFTAGADGRHETALDVMQVAVGDNGVILGDWRRKLSLSLTDEQLRDAKARGILYSTRMTVKKPGAYQVRVALRDTRTAALGSASQFLEVPGVGKGRLALSGVLVRAQTGGGTAAATAARDLAHVEGDSLAADTLGEPSVRIFGPGSDVVYAYEIYDGLGAAAERLTMSAALMRDGKVLYESESTPVDARVQDTSVRVIPIAGRLSLGHDVPPGAYTLQVTVRERRGGKERTARQWVDFDVRH
jgi:VWFA-related protein